MEARFVSKLDKTSSPKGCWIWIAGTSGNGYGGFKIDDKMFRSHRVAFEMWKGRIPDGQLVRHKCDDPLCCNPEHLELGTTADNVNDRQERNRQSKGGDRYNSKLTEDDVREIRMLLRTGITGVEIARRFGVSQDAISKIKSGRNWKHI